MGVNVTEFSIGDEVVYKKSVISHFIQSVEEEEQKPVKVAVVRNITIGTNYVTYKVTLRTEVISLGK